MLFLGDISGCYGEEVFCHSLQGRWRLCHELLDYIFATVISHSNYSNADTDLYVSLKVFHLCALNLDRLVSTFFKWVHLTVLQISSQLKK